MVLLIVFIFFQAAHAQKNTMPSLKVGWERIYVKNVGTFDLPASMEIQAGKYKKIMNDVYRQMEYDAPEIVAQQKGLNGMSKDGFEKYARVMLETQIGSFGDFEKLNFKFTQYTASDINELSLEFRRQVEGIFMGTSLQLMEWFPLRFENINDMSCIHISYIRRLSDNPPVLVHVYYFHNNDRMHTLTLSYRLSESNYWKADYNNILASLRITNTR